MLVLGFDPGLTRTGYALLRAGAAPGSGEALDFGVLAPPVNAPLDRRLGLILDGAGRLLEHHRPDQVVIEELFFARNPQSILKVGTVRGVLFAAALARGVPVASFSPAEVKMAVSGRGNAAKSQVQYMVARMLDIRVPVPEDSADALALCLCYLAHRRARARVATARRPAAPEIDHHG